MKSRSFTRRQFVVGATAASISVQPWFGAMALATQTDSSKPGELLWTATVGQWAMDYDPNGTGKLHYGLIRPSSSETSQIVALDVESGMYRRRYSSANLPLTMGDVVYLNGEQLVALDRETGAELWSAPSRRPIGIDGNILLVGSGKTIYAMDAATGADLWSFNAEGAQGDPAIGSGIALFTNSGWESAFAIRLATGERLWQFESTSQFFPSDVLIGEDSAYVRANKTFTALSAETGELLWQKDAERYLYPIHASNSVLYASDYDGILYALRPSTGETIWNVDSGGSNNTLSAFLEFEGKAFIWSKFQNVIAVDLGSGEILWQSPIGNGYSSWGPPQLEVIGNVLCANNQSFSITGLDLNSGEVLWTFDPEVSVTEAVESDGTVYAQGQRWLLAAEVVTGTPKWQIEIEGFEPHTYDNSQSLQALGGRVFVVDAANLYAFDAATGNEVWRVDFSRVDQHYLIGDRTFYYADGGLIALDTETGVERWRVDGPFWRVNALNEGVAYVTSSNNRGRSVCHALSAANGDELWSVEDAEILAVTTMNVFVGSENAISALNTTGGEPRWSIPQDPPQMVQVSGDRLLIVDRDNSIEVFDASTGLEKWSHSVNAESLWGVVIAGESVFFGAYNGDTTGDLIALDLETGRQQWSVPFESNYPNDRRLTIAGGTLYPGFGQYERSLIALNAETGIERWVLELENDRTSAPFVSNGHVYFGSADSAVYAVSAEPSRAPSLKAGSAALVIAETPLRMAPLVTADVVEMLIIGTEVYLSDDPTNTSNVTWWPVITPNGKSGWVDGSALQGA